MSDFLLFLLFFSPAGIVFLVWHLTEDRSKGRRRMLFALIACSAIGGVIAPQGGGDGHLPGWIWFLIFSGSGWLPALALSFLGKERLPLPEALACFILAPLSLILAGYFCFLIAQLGFE